MKQRIQILLDCDGPLADFAGRYLSVVNTELGTSFVPDDLDTWYMLESECFKMVPPKDLKAAKKRAEQAVRSLGFVSNLAVQPHARKMLECLKPFSDITIVTSPWNSSTCWHYERIQWLRDKLGIQPKDVIFTSDKSRIDGDVLIDDKASHVENWASTRPTKLGMLWQMAHNEQSSCRHARRIGTVEDLVRRIVLHDWR